MDYFGYHQDVSGNFMDEGNWMAWVNHILLGLLAVGQVDPSAVPNGGKLPGQVTERGPVSQQLPISPFPAPQGTGEPEDSNAPPMTPFEAHRFSKNWPEIWGFAGTNLYVSGTRIAPNGLQYCPLASMDLNLNIGLVPDKKVYFFCTDDFWLQRATVNQSHGSFDWTKREFDLDFGLAWNYWGALEFRVFGFAKNNLNRGTSPLLPTGYNDGWALENRYYFPSDDIFDIPRQSFVSIGYMPGKSLTGGDGQTFTPGVFAHGYLAHDLHILNSYVYADGVVIFEDSFALRYLTLEVGVAVRPFSIVEGLEFRLGATDTFDVQPSVNRGLGYLGVRFVF